ncbi:MAG: helix-turn-helix domain-containing protein [Candidatus Dojkabacteria bacterium]|nr:helix-turn-helix domain-containing protein [Candidatus Dojkabacteria bacterium]
MTYSKNKAEEILKNLGLNKDEIAIYLLLAARGPLTILELHKITKVPRSSVYKLTEDLSKKKFVEFLVVYPGIKVKAVRPGNLGIVIQERKKMIEEKQKSLNNLTALTIDDYRKSPKTEIRYYKGIKGMKQLIWNTLDSSKKIYGYSTWDREMSVGHNFEINYEREYVKRELTDHILFDRKSMIGIKKKISLKSPIVPNDKRKVRVLQDRRFYVSGDTYIYNNIYAVNLWNTDEVWGVEIENEKLVEEQMGIFKILWKKSQPLDNFLN